MLLGSYLLALFLLAWLIRQHSALPKNISLLFLAQPLITSMAPVMVFMGGFMTRSFAPDPSWVTLPVTAMIAGTALAAIPAAMMAKKLGRRRATQIGFSMGFIGAMIGVIGLQQQSFWLFIIACLCMGCAGAFAQQLRFAAIESLPDQNQTPRAISLLMLTGIFAAMIGPELAHVSQNWLNTPHTGTFVGIMVLSFVAIGVMQAVRLPTPKEQHTDSPGRPMRQLLKQPWLIIAIAAAALGFGLMSFVMTATPLSMHLEHNHSLSNTKWVIQSHVAAMYLPSLLTVWLGPKIKVRYFLITGSLMFALVIVIAQSGQAVIHYWWALILLGVGWNFMFYAGTTLLPRCYNNTEKHRVQALNDFAIFSCQGLSSLMAGWVIYHHQWAGIMTIAIPFVVILLFISIWSFKQK